jgi:hypothetical protein
MSEDLKIEEVVEQPLEISSTDVTAPETPKISAVEEEAIKQGWKPKDQFEGDHSEWRSAKEFIERGELLSHIHNQNKKTKQLEEALEKLADVNKRVETETRRRTIDELRAKQREAAMSGDVETVEKTTEKLVELNKPVEDNKSQSTVPEEAKVFMDKHKVWFNDETEDNSSMKAYAIAREDILAKKRPDLSVMDRLRLVESDVMKRFPEKFENPNKDTPSPVSGNTPTPPKSKKLSFNDLPDYHKNVVRFAQRSDPKFSVDGYIEQLKLIGEI